MLGELPLTTDHPAAAMANYDTRDCIATTARCTHSARARFPDTRSRQCNDRRTTRPPGTGSFNGHGISWTAFGG